MKDKPKKILLIVLSIVCICGIAIGAVFLLSKDNAKREDGTATPQPGRIVWGDNKDSDFGLLEFKESILITGSLKNAINSSENKKDKFAVLVKETTGASKEAVYNEFVKPLQVDEDYMETEVIFATAEQINSFVCPSEFSLMLSLAVKNENFLDLETTIDKNETTDETDKETEVEKCKVIVYFEFSVETALAEYKEQLETLESEGRYEEERNLRLSVISEGIAQKREAILHDYRISDEELDEVGIYIPNFTAELDARLIEKLLKDARVSSITELEDTEGGDFGLVQ